MKPPCKLGGVICALRKPGCKKTCLRWWLWEIRHHEEREAARKEQKEDGYSAISRGKAVKRGTKR